LENKISDHNTTRAATSNQNEITDADEKE